MWFVWLILIGIFITCAVINSDDKTATSVTSVTSVTSTTKPSPPPSIWEIVPIVDDFGDETNERLLYADAVGLFSNSATTNSLLRVAVRVGESGTAGIVLWEYGSSKMTACCSQVNPYWITVKRSNGHTRKFKAKAYVHDWLIRLNNPRTFVNYLKKSIGDVRIHIRDDGSSSYLFTLSTTGMTKAYNRFKRRQR